MAICQVRSICSVLVEHGLVVTGLHEPPSLPHAEVQETDWTDYQRWFSTIPTLLAISCTPSGSGSGA